MSSDKKITFVDSAESIVAVYNGDGTLRIQGEREDIPTVRQWAERGYDVAVYEADADWINRECRFPDLFREVKLLD